MRGAIGLLSVVLFVFYVFPTIFLFYKGITSFDNSIGNFLIPFLNSIKISISVFFLTIIIGGFFAWLVVKTDFPLKKIVDVFCIISFAIPPYIIALSYVQIFGRNGYLERFVKYFLNFDSFTMSPYSLWAAIIVLTLHLYPLMYFSIKNALRNIEPKLEYAGQLSGATTFKVFYKITLPLILPSLFSSGLFIFSRSLANFSVPALLCLPARIDVATTEIYASLSMLNTSKAAFYSLILVVFSSILYFIQAYFINKKHKISLKGTIPNRDISIVKLRKSKYIILLIVILFFLFVCIIPSIIMFISSLLKRWGLDLVLSNFTLDNYKEIFNLESKSVLAFRNSILFGVIATFFATIIGLSSIVIGHYYGRKYKIFEAIASWPMAIPNTVLAVAAIFAWNRYPLKLYGSVWGLIITYMVLFTPIIINQITGLLNAQDINLFNAARLSGYGKFKAFFKVVFPFLVPGIKSGFIVSLMIALREIPISIMLYSSNQETVGVLLFGMQSQSYGLEMTSALSVIVVSIILVGNLLNKNKNRGLNG